MFVDRERELKALEESYRMFLEGHSRGVLIYGYRKVGKTRLVEEFLRGKVGVLIDLSSARTVNLLRRVFAEKLSELHPISIPTTGDPLADIREIMMAPQRLAKTLNTKIIVALDEFHVMVEKVSAKVARALGRRKDSVMMDILWVMREALTTSRDVFWILISSIGWEKLQEYIARRHGGALVGVLDVLRVDPLPHSAAVRLAEYMVHEREAAEEIARVSGGIPRIVEILARRYNTTREKITILAVNAIREGELDEIFDNMIRTIAEVSRRDYDVLIQALKAVAETDGTTDAVSRALDVSRDTAYAVLEELHKLGMLEKEKRGKRVTYRVRYPLLTEWLKLRVEPRRPWTAIVASALGIAAESYVRELLSEAVNREIRIVDDARGTYLYGTSKMLVLKVRKVYSKRETDSLLRGLKNADVVIETADGTILVIEVKARTREISADDVAKLDRIVDALRSRGMRVRGLLILLGPAHVSPAAVSEAVRRGIIILSHDAVKLLAKTLNFPHW